MATPPVAGPDTSFGFAPATTLSTDEAHLPVELQRGAGHLRGAQLHKRIAPVSVHVHVAHRVLACGARQTTTGGGNRGGGQRWGAAAGQPGCCCTSAQHREDSGQPRTLTIPSHLGERRRHGRAEQLAQHVACSTGSVGGKGEAERGSKRGQPRFRAAQLAGQQRRQHGEASGRAVEAAAVAGVRAHLSPGLPSGCPHTARAASWRLPAPPTRPAAAAPAGARAAAAPASAVRLEEGAGGGGRGKGEGEGRLRLRRGARSSWRMRETCMVHGALHAPLVRTCWPPLAFLLNPAAQRFESAASTHSLAGP